MFTAIISCLVGGDIKPCLCVVCLVDEDWGIRKYRPAVDCHM